MVATVASGGRRNARGAGAGAWRIMRLWRRMRSEQGGASRRPASKSFLRGDEAGEKLNGNTRDAPGRPGKDRQWLFLVRLVSRETFLRRLSFSCIRVSTAQHILPRKIHVKHELTLTRDEFFAAFLWAAPKVFPIAICPSHLTLSLNQSLFMLISI